MSLNTRPGRFLFEDIGRRLPDTTSPPPGTDVLAQTVKLESVTRSGLSARSRSTSATPILSATFADHVSNDARADSHMTNSQNMRRGLVSTSVTRWMRRYAADETFDEALGPVG